MDNKQADPESFDGLEIESVSDEGDVVLRFPAGGRFRFKVSRENIVFYRRIAKNQSLNPRFWPPPTD